LHKRIKEGFLTVVEKAGELQRNEREEASSTKSRETERIW